MKKLPARKCEITRSELVVVETGEEGDGFWVSTMFIGISSTSMYNSASTGQVRMCCSMEVIVFYFGVDLFCVFRVREGAF